MTKDKVTERSVVIVGSGIIGLSVLYRLIEEIESKPLSNIHYSINVVTTIDKELLCHYNTADVIFDQEIASVYAGAHQRPFPTEYINGDKKITYQRRESLYTKETFEYILDKLQHNKDWKNFTYDTTIQLCRGYDLIKKASEAYQNFNDGYNESNLKNFIKDDNSLDESIVPKLIQNSLDMICSYDTYVVNTPRFLRFLYNYCCSRSKTISNIDLAFHFNQEIKYLENAVDFSLNVKPLIVNCTGKGTIQWNKEATLCSTYLPIRGQTLLISVPDNVVYRKFAKNTVTFQDGGKWSFVINRPLPKAHKNFGKKLYFIIGGTKQSNSLDKNISNEDLNYVLNNAKMIYPKLFKDGEWQLERVNVGFRPGSKIGSVVNLEHKARIDKKTYYPVINCYGFAGYGVECSFGAANHVLALINRAFREANL
ncbi:uncharacterized protein HGUI_00175 [Hanseniaspora guilliermondii]|uniref:FAD dependent oxidoreductase domain-containing protein n=1 Tax=Hanseniaspora guilliermondii TaxID=56406 RepID=A0A1L0CT94_9ASCO|nr:uncharacterized protein HGUI_00175 [Hanseniaspora guilliermondii]